VGEQAQGDKSLEGNRDKYNGKEENMGEQAKGDNLLGGNRDKYRGERVPKREYGRASSRRQVTRREQG